MRIKKNQINKGIIESKDIELDVTIKEAKPITEKEKDALFSYESANDLIIIAKGCASFGSALTPISNNNENTTANNTFVKKIIFCEFREKVLLHIILVPLHLLRQ